MNVVLFLVGERCSQLLIIFFSYTENTGAIPNHQFAPTAKDALVAAKKFFPFQLHTMITHDGRAETILFPLSKSL